MRIVIAGGSSEVDYLIKLLKKRHHQLIVINKEREYCEYLSTANEMSVFFGDPSRKYTLEDAGIANSDVIVALSANDAENLVICQLAKRCFGVKKAIAILRNPKNVNVFRNLGVNTAFSASMLIAQTIEKLSIVDELVQSLSIEDEKIVLSEIKIAADAAVGGRALRELDPPVNFIVSCIFRDPEVVIPNGSTTIRPDDKLVIVSTPADQEAILAFLQKKADHA